MLRDKRRCNFEAKWFKEEGFSETVEEKWQESEHNGAISVLERLKAMHDGQHDWDCTILKVPKKSPRKAHWELEVAMRGPLTPENNQKKFELRRLTENLLEQKEIKWSQRSRTNWIQNGDKLRTSSIPTHLPRKKRNFFKWLKNPTGNFVEGTHNFKPVILNYFTNLFSSKDIEVGGDMPKRK
jgi:hypothetical protein